LLVWLQLAEGIAECILVIKGSWPEQW